MAKKFLSIIIIPHNKGKSKNIKLSKKKIKTAATIAGIVFVILVVFLVDYFSMNGIRSKYRELCEESARQKETLAKYKESVNSLEETVKNFDQYRKKLNIMAGLKSEEVLSGEPGIGGESSEEMPVLSNPGDLDFNRLQNINAKSEGIENNLNTLVNFFENQTLELAATPSIMPTKGWITSSFGMRDDPFTGKRAFHWGIDIATNYGNQVIAAADGVIFQTKTEKIGGKTIKISHPRTGYTTVYCHLSKYLVKPGQRVKRGDTIGLVGKTGRASAPHVHYEVRLNGKRLNPWYYILDD